METILEMVLGLNAPLAGGHRGGVTRGGGGEGGGGGGGGGYEGPTAYLIGYNFKVLG